MRAVPPAPPPPTTPSSSTGSEPGSGGGPFPPSGSAGGDPPFAGLGLVVVASAAEHQHEHQPDRGERGDHGPEPAAAARGSASPGCTAWPGVRSSAASRLGLLRRLGSASASASSARLRRSSSDSPAPVADQRILDLVRAGRRARLARRSQGVGPLADDRVGVGAQQLGERGVGDLAVKRQLEQGAMGGVEHAEGFHEAFRR